MSGIKGSTRSPEEMLEILVEGLALMENLAVQRPINSNIQEDRVQRHTTADLKM